MVVWRGREESTGLQKLSNLFITHNHLCLSGAVHVAKHSGALSLWARHRQHMYHSHSLKENTVANWVWMICSSCYQCPNQSPVVLTSSPRFSAFPNLSLQKRRHLGSKVKYCFRERDCHDKIQTHPSLHSFQYRHVSSYSRISVSWSSLLQTNAGQEGSALLLYR
jgi:hypothetical protein